MTSIISAFDVPAAVAAVSNAAQSASGHLNRNATFTYVASAADSVGGWDILVKEIQNDIFLLQPSTNEWKPLSELPIWQTNVEWETTFRVDKWKEALLKLKPKGAKLWTRWLRVARGKESEKSALAFLDDWYQRNQARETKTETPQSTEPDPEPLAAPENTHAHSLFINQDAILRAEDDALRHTEIAQAVVDFITDEGTKLPLTLSIEGEWGTGKSSFMGILKGQLDPRDDEGNRSPESEFIAVWFNPWRYETVEAMWAAFAISVMDQLKQGLTRWQQFKIWWRLFRRRCKQSANAVRWPRFIAMVAGPVLIGVCAALFFAAGGDSPSALPQTAWTDYWFFPVIALILSTGKKALSMFGNPIAQDLKVFFDEPNYAEQTTILQRFHTDLRFIMTACSEVLGEKDKPIKIAIFIDDLDRCEVPIASEVLRTLNLFLSMDQDESGNGKRLDAPKIVTFLGMDREKVAASIAAQHEKILPWLEGNTDAESANGKPSRADGLRFGYRYLEKFIHITLMLPSPGEAQMATFLEKHCGKIETNTGPKIPPAAGGTATGGDQKTQETTETTKDEEEEKPKKPRRRFLNPFRGRKEKIQDHPQPLHEKTVSKEKETQLVGECTGLSIKALGSNPRRIKQFINLYRLRIRLADALKVYMAQSEEPASGKHYLTLEQMGKLVALELASPLLTMEVRKDRDFFKSPETRSNDAKGILKRRPELQDLISNKESDWRWDMKRVDLDRYAQIGLPSSGAMRSRDEE